MVQGAQQMSCSGCGGSDFHVYISSTPDGTEDGETKLHIECKTCQGVTDVGADKPSLTIGCGVDNDKGILTCLKRGNRR